MVTLIFIRRIKGRVVAVVKLSLSDLAVTPREAVNVAEGFKRAGYERVESNQYQVAIDALRRGDSMERKK